MSQLVTLELSDDLYHLIEQAAWVHAQSPGGWLREHVPQMVRRLTKHLSVASDIGNLGAGIRPLLVKHLHASKSVRKEYGLLTNVSLIVAVMRDQKLRDLATHDAGFRRVSGLRLWMPGSSPPRVTGDLRAQTSSPLHTQAGH